MLTVTKDKLTVDGYLMTAAGDDPSIDHYEMTKLRPVRGDGPGGGRSDIVSR
jgi:hypothetical protein